MQTALITGAGGYIGSALSELFLDSGYRVIGLDRYFFGLNLLGDLLDRPGFTPVTKDIRDVEADDFQGVDVVCDLAGLSNDPSGDLDPALTLAINHEGRVRVARAAREAGVRRYVLASSCSVYGKGEASNLTEDAPARPVSTYAKANLLAEGDVLRLATSDFAVTVLRQATVFGVSRRMRFDLVINLMTLNAVLKGRIFVTGGGQQWRPIIHVQDAARAFKAAAESDAAAVNGQVFNVGALNLKVINLAYTVRENIPFPVEMEIVPDDPDRRTYNVSFAKLGAALGLRPAKTPADGVKEIYEGLKSGQVEAGPTTQTVGWYKKILEAKELVGRLTLNGRLL